MVAIALSFLAATININCSSSTDKGEGTSNFKTLSELYQSKLLFILKLADWLLCNSRNPERKRQKTFMWQWKNSTEKERLEENGE